MLLRFKVPGKEDVQLHFVAFDLPVSVEPKLLLGLRRKHYESTFNRVEFLASEACKVNGLAGHRHVFRHVPEKGKPRRVHEVIWCKARSGYLLTLAVDESAYEDLKPSFTAMLESFEDLERK